jgi:curved DNA-binding protein CbpA
MGQGKSRQNTYDIYYNALQQNREIDLSTLSPYDVLEVSKDFTWDELVKAYRKIAMKTHPDKGGSEMLFNVATHSFKILAKEYKNREIEKPHDVLKQNFKEYESDNKPSDKPSIFQNNGGNFSDKFNKLFEENKLEDEDNDDNRGYAHLMDKSTKEREDIKIPKLLKKFNEKKFNKTFETVVKPSTEVIIYKEPEPLMVAKTLDFTELGGKTDDFTTDPSKQTTLRYTDYQKAHTTQRLVDPRSVSKRKEYKNITDYETDRNTITEKRMDEKELGYQKERDIYRLKQEEARVQRLKERDEKVKQHHDKVNQLVLGLR